MILSNVQPINECDSSRFYSNLNLIVGLSVASIVSVAVSLFFEWIGDSEGFIRQRLQDGLDSTDTEQAEAIVQKTEQSTLLFAVGMIKQGEDEFFKKEMALDKFQSLLSLTNGNPRK